MHETTDLGRRSVEYTHRWYGDFLEWLRSRGYSPRPVTAEPGTNEAMLRHDVDLSVEAAVDMARVEADHDVYSTYFFLVSSPLYNVMERQTRDRIHRIAEMGHEVGLHFSTHQYWDGETVPDEWALTTRVRREQAVLGATTDSIADPVSFHIPPDWVLDRSFDAFPSTYQPSAFTEIGYVADSSGRWHDDPPLDEDLPGRLQVLTHPGLWGERRATFEDRVEAAIADACDRTRERARQEFFEGVYG